MDELWKCQPMINVYGKGLHFRKRRHAAAYRQQRQVGEDTDQHRKLSHCDVTSLLLGRGRYHQMARPPTANTATRIDKCKPWTKRTVSPTKTKSLRRLSRFLPSCTVTEKLSPTAAAAMVASIAATTGSSPWLRYAIAAATMIRAPGRQIPRMAATAPLAPRRRSPARIAIFVPLRPGRASLIDNIWTNVGSSIHP